MTAPVNARHSAADPDWYTDPRIVKAAHQVFGGPPELDPMSDHVANQVVQAQTIFTKEMDGLAQRWIARSVFINPAGGTVGAAWNKLIQAFHTHLAIREAIWVGFSLEQLQTLQNQSTSGLTPMNFAMCVPQNRIAFVENAAKREERYAVWLGKSQRAALGQTFRAWSEKTSPTHANYITYLGDRYARFEQAFRPIGACRP
jgi:hypothetical protein